MPILRRLIFALSACATAVVWLANVAQPTSAQPSTESISNQYPRSSIRFEHLTIEDGLSQNAGLAIFQDSQGYLWIGSQDGLNRYDGYTFTIFKHDPDNPFTLSHNSVISIAETPDGYLWFGTWGGGLNRFDPASGQFMRYLPDAENPDAISDGTIADILPTEDNNLWVSTQNGLEYLDTFSGKFTHYRHNPEDPYSISSNTASALALDSDGNLWVGTGSFNVPGNGLNLFDPFTGQFRKVELHSSDPGALNISDLEFDAKGNLWVASGGYNLPGAGMFYIDQDRDQIIQYSPDTAGAQPFPSRNPIKLHFDREGVLWITTWEAGALQMMPDDSGEYIQHTYDSNRPASVSGNSLWSIYEDRSGVIWIGSLNAGINKYNPHTRQFGLYESIPGDPNSLAFPAVGCFEEDVDGMIWICTWGGGINQFDPQSGNFQTFVSNPDDPSTISNNVVMALLVDQRGNLWVGSLGGGIDIRDKKTGSFTHFRSNPEDPYSLPSDSITSFVQIPNGDIWIGTFGGLVRFDQRTGRFITYAHDPGRLGSLSDDKIVSLHLGANNILWVGTWGGGLNKLDLNDSDSINPQAARFEIFKHDPEVPNSLSENSVWVIYEDQRGFLWMGTQAGLNRLHLETGNFRRYTEKNGLPNDSVLGILEDDNGRLWISTNHGLARFDPITEKFTVFDVTDGLQSNEFDSNAYYISSDGRMYFGGIHGFNTFFPDQINDNPYIPPVVVTSFSVFNRPLALDLSGETPIRLSYQENFIAFEFAALDYHAPDKNRYSYYLEGVDPSWVDAGSRRYASYTNLRGGEYIFRVRGSNSDGVWNTRGIAIPVTVTPPFYEEWWFQVGAGVAVLGVIFGGLVLRLQSTRDQRRKLEAEVIARTHELQLEIEQREKAEQALAQQAAATAVASERNRLARELHDAVTQTLFSASLIADVLPDLWEIKPDDGRKRLEELRQLTRGALAEMRTLLFELRPNALVEVALQDLLRQYTEALVGRARIPIQLIVEGNDRLPPDVQVAFYRITQESLNNIVKHSKAKSVIVQLKLGPVTRLTITDDGVGFDVGNVPADHLGIKIMKERAEAIGARYAIESEPGQGTQITLTWAKEPVIESTQEPA